jgi:hypothetical protein
MESWISRASSVAMKRLPTVVIVRVGHVVAAAIVLMALTASAQAGATVSQAPLIGPMRVQTAGAIERYARFEVAFDVTGTSATNPYFPYEPNPPPGVPAGVGITVNALLLPPGQTDWANSRSLPCFYYQPVQQLSSGADVALVPTGKAEWRCRFTPEIVGTWQYKIRATDSGGTSESAVYQFSCTNSTRRGFVRVSPTDWRFFEFSDGTPFVTPLVNVEEGSPFNSVSSIRQNIQRMGNNGIRFVRWFPTGEGANYAVIPFGDSVSMSWQFSASIGVDDVDTAAGKLFSFKPTYYSTQQVPALPSARYRLSFRAKVVGEQVLRAEVNSARLDVCSAASTYHGANGTGDTCGAKRDGWNDYTVTFVNSDNAPIVAANLRGLYVSTDAPAPYSNAKPGRIRIHSTMLQRDETGNGGWGPNLLTRSDPDTFEYVDQIGAARLDEIFAVSEQHGVYHKLTLFHKNDDILNRFLPDGTVTAGWDDQNRPFYSQAGQAARWYESAYARYFVARWSYTPALHSLELANENQLTQESYAAGFAMTDLVYSLSPRPLLTSNSFWGWFVDPYFNDPEHKDTIDYSDKHWYANETGAGTPEHPGDLISSQYRDSAAYVRECWQRFKERESWFSLHEPFVRGEGGVARSGTGPQHPDIARDPKGTYYHKKLWAHVGVLGYSCDGEWYPRLFISSSGTQFPNATYDLAKMFAAYERFMQGERLSNGRYREIGTDVTSGVGQVLLADATGNLRAWGRLDATAGKGMLWIDNANQTWWNVVQGVAIGASGARIMIQGLPQGTYAAEWWDTITGAPTRTESLAVGSDGRLTLTVTGLAGDIAVKFSNTASSGPKQATIALRRGWNLMALPLIPTELTPGAIFAPVDGKYSAVFAYNACDSADPWRKYVQNAPSFTNDLTTIGIAQGLWIQVTEDITLTVTGSAPVHVDIPLCVGANLISYPTAMAAPLPDALASIAGKYERIYAYDASDPADPWKMFAPNAAPAANDLIALNAGKGYWLHMTEAAVLGLNAEANASEGVSAAIDIAGWQ